MLVTKLQAADLMGVSTEWVSMMISTKALTRTIKQTAPR